MAAKQYIWVYSGESGLLLMPDQMQVSAPDLYLCSPQNYIYPVLDEESVDYVLNEYEAAKRSVPPIIASDGSFIRREGYWDDEMDDEALFEYYVNNVVDKVPAYTYKDPNYPLAAGYEAWLDDVYGRTEMGKFWDYMETLDGIQDALDVIGLVWDGADVINFIISVCRGDWERAAWSFVGTLPLAGSLIARAGRGVTKTSKVALGAANAVSGGRTVVKELELTISALGEEFEHCKKLLQNMVEDIKKTGKAILETPISIRIERVSLQFADGGYVGFGGYRVIINFADDVESAVGGGRKTEKVLGGGLGGGSGFVDKSKFADKLTGYKPYTDDMREFIYPPQDGYEAFLERKYIEIRKSGLDDVSIVAKNTGLSEQEIIDLKRHIFLDTHELSFDGAPCKTSYFTADPDLAYAWEAATKGELSAEQKAWFREMADHELGEKALMDQGMPLRDPSTYKDDYGFQKDPLKNAHDAAPQQPGTFPGSTQIEDFEKYYDKDPDDF